MVSTPLWAQKTLEIKGFLGLERPFLDLVSKTPRPRGGGRPLFAYLIEEENPPEKNPLKIKKFIWTSLSEQFLSGSWLISQEGRQKFARTFRKSSCKRGVFFGVSGFGVGFAASNP